MADDDDWGEEETLSAPKALGTFIVVKDYIPENNSHLTLILDDLVYVFKKEVSGKQGFWEGETKGIYGIFPSAYVKPLGYDQKGPTQINTPLVGESKAPKPTPKSSSSTTPTPKPSSTTTPTAKPTPPTPKPTTPTPKSPTPPAKPTPKK